VNVAPKVTNDISTQNVQANGAIQPVTVSARDIASDQPYTIATSYTVNGGSPVSGLPSGLSISSETYTASGLYSGLTTCSQIVTGSANVPAGKYNITVAAADKYSATGSTTFTLNVGGAAPIALPGQANPPTDPDHDGLYEDLSGNGAAGFTDVVLFFNNLQWIQNNEPVSAFDFSGNGGIAFKDIELLFYKVSHP
jgi:PKD repeat protein